MSGEKGKSAGNGNKLSPEQYSAIAEAVAKCLNEMPAGELYKSLVEAVIAIHEEQKEKELEEEVDKRADNVYLLLKNYRKFKLYAKNAVTDIKKAKRILEETLCDINSLKDELKVEAIIRTRERTLVMIAHIDKMVKIYKKVCEESDDPADMRRWKIIYEYYLSPERKTIDEICAGLFIERATFYNDIKIACKALGPLLFGLAGI